LPILLENFWGCLFGSGSIVIVFSLNFVTAGAIEPEGVFRIIHHRHCYVYNGRGHSWHENNEKYKK
jgi:hypothetical protein